MHLSYFFSPSLLCAPFKCFIWFFGCSTFVLPLRISVICWSTLRCLCVCVSVYVVTNEPLDIRCNSLVATNSFEKFCFSILFSSLGNNFPTFFFVCWCWNIDFQHVRNNLHFVSWEWMTCQCKFFGSLSVSWKIDEQCWISH